MEIVGSTQIYKLCHPLFAAANLIYARERYGLAARAFDRIFTPLIYCDCRQFYISLNNIRFIVFVDVYKLDLPVFE